jgi:pantoate--beta-alanine ligase
MLTLASIPELRATLRGWRARGETVAFVPTMGNLHAGHIKLVEEAGPMASRRVVSIFVNPAQFGPGEDFEVYPRTPHQDAEQLRKAGTDLLFLPTAAIVYPSGVENTTFVEVPGLSEDLCGRFRPGHFRGVATVVCKLFHLVQPDVALFGEKDYQQLALIRRMVADLDMNIRIVGVPTVRESDGLAMSSRNAYLSPEERARAVSLYRCLRGAAEALASGERDFAAIETKQSEELAAAGFRPDYVAIRRQSDLRKPAADDRELIVLAAAWLGKTRLIDNLKLMI